LDTLHIRKAPIGTAPALVTKPLARLQDLPLLTAFITPGPGPGRGAGRGAGRLAAVPQRPRRMARLSWRWPPTAPRSELSSAHEVHCFVLHRISKGALYYVVVTPNRTWWHPPDPPFRIAAVRHRGARVRM
jgi:hypothetical protein